MWQRDVTDPAGALDELVPNSAGHVQLVQNGVAWVGLIDHADPSPPHLPKGEPFDTLASINLATGATTTLVYRPGQAVMFVGLDSSNHPIVTVLPPPLDQAVPIQLMTAPGAAGVTIPAPLNQVSLGQADNGRLWFGGANGIYYWTPVTGLTKVYSFHGDAATQQTIAPAGHCV